MPLIFQTHRPPQLQQEIRNLYREIGKLDRDTASRFTTIISQIDGNGNGNGEEVEGGTIYAWAKMVDLMSYGEGCPGDEIAWDVATIEAVAYTHLEVDALIVRADTELNPPSFPTLTWQVFGTHAFQYSTWEWQPGDSGFWMPKMWPYDGPSFHYRWPTVGMGRFRPIPSFVMTASPPELAECDLAYMPIMPDGGTDVLRLGLAWPSGACRVCKAWVVGRYIVHDGVEWGELCPNM